MTERLEEIKEHYQLWRFNEKNRALPSSTGIDYEDLIYLVNCVEELEEDLLELVKQNKEFHKSIAFYSSESYNAHLERLLDRREQQNQRLKQVLEFYANEKNYERAYDDEVLFDYLPSEIDLDNGEKARKELGKEA